MRSKGRTLGVESQESKPAGRQLENGKEGSKGRKQEGRRGRNESKYLSD